MKEKTFALCFSNYGFTPGELVRGSRDDAAAAVIMAGCHYIMTNADLTRCGGIAEAAGQRNKRSRLTKGSFRHHTVIREGHNKIIRSEASATRPDYDEILFKERGVRHDQPWC